MTDSDLIDDNNDLGIYKVIVEAFTLLSSKHISTTKSPLHNVGIGAPSSCRLKDCKIVKRVIFGLNHYRYFSESGKMGEFVDFLSSRYPQWLNDQIHLCLKHNSDDLGIINDFDDDHKADEQKWIDVEMERLSAIVDAKRKRLRRFDGYFRARTSRFQIDGMFS